jgi:phosphoglucosamine mutase
MPRTLFGTDGVRGRANSEPMTAEIAMRIGMAAGQVFRRGAHRTAWSSARTRACPATCWNRPWSPASPVRRRRRAFLLGPCRRPAVGILTRSMRADIGVMISASHNPYDDNGIKLFGPDGFKLSDAVEMRDRGAGRPRPGAKLAASPRSAAPSASTTCRRPLYRAVKRTLPRGRPQRSRVVVDCANGAAYKVAPWRSGNSAPRS